MKKIILNLIVVLSTINLFAQAPEIEWEKSFGGSGSEDASAVAYTSDGGYIITGWTSSTDGDVTENEGCQNTWTIKLDSSGNIQWQKSFGGSNFETFNSVQQTTDGGYILGGYTLSNDGDVSGNHGLYDYWIVKLDILGNIQWQKALGGSSSDIGSSIKQTADGGYIIAGVSSSNNGDVSGNHSNSQDYWVVKLNASGNIQWQKSLGGSNADLAYSTQQTSDGGYVGWLYKI